MFDLVYANKQHSIIARMDNLQRRLQQVIKCVEVVNDMRHPANCQRVLNIIEEIAQHEIEPLRKDCSWKVVIAQRTCDHAGFLYYKHHFKMLRLAVQVMSTMRSELRSLGFSPSVQRARHLKDLSEDTDDYSDDDCC